VPPETCPLCDAPTALLRGKERPSEIALLRRRIATLRQRIVDLEEGEITPRQLRDDVLWMCADCQRLMADLPSLDLREVQRRIHEQVRQLERTLAARARRAG
jgi:hypothetical protein